MKKYNLYYGTEENAYEIDKHGPMSLEEAIDNLQKWVDEEEDWELDREMCKKVVEECRYFYEEMENTHDYRVIIGIAKEGNTEVEGYLNELRKEFIGEFDDDDDEDIEGFMVCYDGHSEIVSGEDAMNIRVAEIEKEFNLDVDEIFVFDMADKL